MAGNSSICGYTDLQDFFRTIVDSLSKNDAHFVYAYWPSLDTINHLAGPESNDSKMHFLEINTEYEEFLENITDTSTIVLTTADHGFIGTNIDKRVTLDNHPELQSCLRTPLSGEPRTSFCHVRKEMKEKFFELASSNLGYMCEIYPTLELIEDNWFGLYEPNKRLFERIGDYALIPKENYYFELKYSGRAFPNFLGLHGGVTEDEMLIPLIVATG
jgi:hypothetical protein